MARRCRNGAVGDRPVRRHGAFRRAGGGCLCPVPLAEWSHRPRAYRTEIPQMTTVLTHEICSPALPPTLPSPGRGRGLGEGATSVPATYACLRNNGPLHLRRICSGD